MRSIMLALATGAAVTVTIGGAYAAGAVGNNGHEVNGHAAGGRTVAAAARTEHGKPVARSERSSEPSGTAASRTAAKAPSTAPAEKGEHGQHNGRVNAHRHYGHHWGRGHGKGAVVRPDNPNKPVKPTSSRN